MMLRSPLTVSLLTTFAVALLAPQQAAAGDLPGWIKPAPERPLHGVNNPEKPGLLFVEFEEVEILSYCGGGVNTHSSQNCGVVADDTTFPAWGDADSQSAIMDAINAAFMPYDLVITQTRPDFYVNYNMIVVTDMAYDMSESQSCTFGGAACDGAKRNSVALVTGDTMMCMNRDATIGALFAAGTLAGLEGTDDAADPMFYPPDFSALAASFTDNCATLTVTAAQCDNIHKVYCNDDTTMQNSHQELLATYGARADDTTAPTIDSITPMDGDVVARGDAILPTATLTEDSTAVAVLWSVTLPDADMTVFNKCNNKGAGCSDEWNYTVTPVEGPYDFLQISNSGDAPSGDYVFTFEAQDMYGNKVTETMTVTYEPGAGGDTTSGGDGADSADGGDDGADSADGGDGGDETTTGDDDGGDDAGSGDEDSGGCSCTTTPTGGAALAPLALLALGLRRRRS